MSLEFKKVSGPEPVVNFLTATIKEQLAKKRSVLWVVTGGSSMPIVVAVCRQLEDIDLSNLTVTLGDERYGPLGHNDSNWAQLKDLGFYLPGANLQPILTGKSLPQTVRDYNQFLKKSFEESDYKIGFIGIGPDSHIAGIKPRSPATTAKNMAVGYKWDDYIRITMTFPALKLLDCAVTYLIGESKQAATLALTKSAPLAEAPSQILKKLKKAIIFNDRLGEKYASKAQG